jgi:sugar phosphate isomerase/epimerase
VLLGYNTNGFAHHRLEEAIDVLAEIGYQSVAITLDHGALDPFDSELPRQLARVRARLQRYSMNSVVETGARFLLDPRRKHQPTLVSADLAESGRRLNFLRRAVVIARELGANAVSLWSGKPTDKAPRDVLMARLVDGCRRLADYAADCGVRLAFEPEPGMYINTMDRFAALHQQLDHPAFGLTIDVGHLHCMGEEPISYYLRAWRERLWNVHIEDMRRGVHEHLLFGAGNIEFGPILETLHDIGYAGGVHVELSRHSHDAVAVARDSLGFLKGFLKDITPQ